MFRKYVPHKSTQSNVPVTKPNARAWQDALAVIKYQGDHFPLKKGSALNTKGCFILEERQCREAESKDLETKKQNSIAIDKLNERALALIEEFDKK